VYRLILHRRDLRRVVAAAHSALTTTRFMRLTALCVAYLCVGIPLAFVSAYQYINTAGTYADYSWTYMRSGVSSLYMMRQRTEVDVTKRLPRSGLFMVFRRRKTSPWPTSRTGATSLSPHFSSPRSVSAVKARPPCGRSAKWFEGHR
jgi:hypothetical protein